MERIPNSFSQALEVNEEVFTEFTQVFKCTGVFQLVEYRWNSCIHIGIC